MNARLRAKISSAYRLGPFIRPRADRVAYIGPGRSTNLGDYCMLQAYRTLLPALEFAVLPHGSPHRLLSRLDRLIRGRVISAIALGGGTLIGSSKYRLQLEALADAFPDTPLFMFGVGVEDPTPIGGRQLTTPEELRLWERTLRRFGAIRVRGPLSKSILDEIGVDSMVSGDSALVLGDEYPAESYEHHLLGLNVGLSDPIWGQDPRRVWREIVRAGRTLIDRGWRIRVLPVWPPDREYAASVARALGHRAEVREHFGELAHFLDSVRECDVFVGLKLHSVVLASAVFVPSVALEYRPKCRDFQLSVDRARYTIRTDSIVADSLVGLVEEMSDDRPRHQSELFAHVSRLRSTLVAAASATESALRPLVLG